MTTKLIQAIRAGKLDEVTKILGEPYLNINQVDEAGNTALHWLDFAKGQDTRKGINILSFTVYQKYFDILNALIKAGANVNIKNKANITALHLAAFYNHFHIAKALIAAGAEVNIPNDEGRTALHLAAATGNVHTVQALLNSKLIQVYAKDKYNKTAWHYALENGMTFSEEALRSVMLDPTRAVNHPILHLKEASTIKEPLKEGGVGQDLHFDHQKTARESASAASKQNDSPKKTSHVAPKAKPLSGSKRNNKSKPETEVKHTTKRPKPNK